MSYKNFYEEQFKEGKEVCRKCGGRKYNMDRKIAIATVCEHCQGKGIVYWIDNMTGNPAAITYGSKEARQMAEQNAQYLLTEAKKLFYEAGMVVLITVEQHQAPTSYVGKLFSI